MVPTAVSAVAQLRDCALPRARPYAGWALERAAEIEAESPSFLASSFYFASAKRQATFCVLSDLTLGVPAEEVASRFGAAAPSVCPAGLSPLAQIGRAIIVLRPKALLDCLRPEPSPPGLQGTLARLGTEVAGPPERYHQLRELFASRDLLARKRARVLAQTEGGLTGERVAVVLTLDPALLHAGIVSKLDRPADATLLNDAFAEIEKHCSAEASLALRQSIGQIGSRSVQRLVREGATRFDRLPDFDLNLSGEGPELIVLGSAAAMIDAGRRFRNCLGDRLGHVLTGERVYLEHSARLQGEGAIVELTRLWAGWVLEGVYGPRNRRVPKALASEIRAKLVEAGVQTYASAGEKGPGATALALWLERAGWEETYKRFGFGREAAQPTHLAMDEAA